MPAFPCSASAIITSAAPARRRPCWRWSNLLRDAGEAPIVLSRGYGGKLRGPIKVDPDRHAAGDVGDEPLMMARTVPVVVARDRADGVALARSQGASVILMDDGFQNPAIAKDASLIVVDGDRGVGNGCVFPAGPLRAPLPPQLARTDALIIVGDGTAADGVAAAIAAQGGLVLRAHLVPDRGFGRGVARQTRAGLRGHRRSRQVFQDAARERSRSRRGESLRRSSSVFGRRDRSAGRRGEARWIDAGDHGKGSGAAARRGTLAPAARDIVPFAVTLKFDDDAGIAADSRRTGCSRQGRRNTAEIVGWAKRSVPTINRHER